MVIGIPDDRFWKLNPHKLKPYFEAYKLKQKEQIAMMNLEAWYHGIYVRDAIGSCLSNEHEYPSKPHDLTASKEISATTDTAVNADALRFSAWTKSFNQNFAKQHPELEKQPESL